MNGGLPPVSLIGDRPIVTIEGIGQDPIGRAERRGSGDLSVPRTTRSSVKRWSTGWRRGRSAIPIAYRLKLLNPQGEKLRAALRLLEQTSSWRKSLPRNQAAGIACTDYNGTAVACAAAVSIENKRPKIHRVTVAVHCGQTVNPLSIESQLQGGIIFGLTQLMPNGVITLKDGRVQQRNFDTFTPPYIGDSPPEIDVHIVPSSEPPTGCGESSVPVISPAVANAVYSVTKQRLRSLPMRLA